MIESKLDRRCVSALIKSGNVVELMDQGITPDFFQANYRNLYEYVLTHYGRYGVVPDMTTIKSRFSWFVSSKANESMGYYAHMLRERQIFSIMKDHLLDVQEQLAKGNVMDAFAKVQELSALGVNKVLSPRDMCIGDDGGAQLIAYEKAKTGNYPGISSGFHLLDSKITCIENCDFVVIGASPKTGKSWFTLSMADKMLQGDRSLKILYFSKEMKRSVISRRFHALLAGVQYRHIRRGTMTPFEEARFKAACAYSKEVLKDRLIIIGDDGFDDFSSDYDMTNTLDFVDSKINQYKPGVVFIDGYYLMSAGAGTKKRAEWENKTDLTRKGKRLCNKNQVPMIVTTQLGKDSWGSDTPSLANFSYTSSFAMDTDLAFLLFKNRQMIVDGELGCNLAKIREDEDGGNILFDFKPAIRIDALEEVEDTESLLEEEGG